MAQREIKSWKKRSSNLYFPIFSNCFWIDRRKRIEISTFSQIRIEWEKNKKVIFDKILKNPK